MAPAVLLLVLFKHSTRKIRRSQKRNCSLRFDQEGASLILHTTLCENKTTGSGLTVAAASNTRSSQAPSQCEGAERNVECDPAKHHDPLAKHQRLVGQSQNKPMKIPTQRVSRSQVLFHHFIVFYLSLSHCELSIRIKF